MKIGEKIREYREKAGISQEELGNLAGLSRFQISRIERGTSVPPFETLQKIAGALKVDVIDFWYGIEYVSVVCSNCGLDKHAKDARYCHRCGTPLFNFCTSCNTRLDDTANFCPICGRKASKGNF